MHLIKLIFSLSLFCWTSSALFAQDYEKGDAHFHIGVGLPNKIFQEDHKWRVIPIVLTCEKAVINNLTVGGSLGYSSSRSIIYRFLGDPYFHQHRYILGMVRTTYHLNIFNQERFDTYAGIGAGVKIGWSEFVGKGDLADFKTQPVPARSGFIYSVFAGVHYTYNNYFRFFGELGIGSMPIALGIQIKL
jgi:hypothetical protein